MLHFLQSSGRASDRKLRLFACASVRRLWHLLPDPRGRGAAEVAERYADGLAPREQLVRAAEDAVLFLLQTNVVNRAAWYATTAACAAATYFTIDKTESVCWNAARSAAVDAATAVYCATLNVLAPEVAFCHPDDASVAPPLLSAGAARAAIQAYGTEEAAQCRLLRCIFGPFPLRPVMIDPSWRTPEVITLAATIYDARDFALLPDLAAALEACGCSDAGLLGHLRSPGPHARGCHALDALLGRE
jgi:hypothetical protein